MSDISFPTDVSLVGRYIPDEWDGIGVNPHDQANPVTGFYEVGVLIGGVYRPLTRLKASGLYADIQRAQEAGEHVVPGSPVEPPPAQP